MYTVYPISTQAITPQLPAIKRLTGGKFQYCPEMELRPIFWREANQKSINIIRPDERDIVKALFSDWFGQMLVAAIHLIGPPLFYKVLCISSDRRPDHNQLQTTTIRINIQQASGCRPSPCFRGPNTEPVISAGFQHTASRNFWKTLTNN